MLAALGFQHVAHGSLDGGLRGVLVEVVVVVRARGGREGGGGGGERERGETRARAGKVRRPRWRLGTRARAWRRPNEMRRRGDDRSRGAGASGEARPRARARDAARTRTTRRWTWSRPAEGPMDVRSGARGCGQGGFRSATKAGTTSSEPRCPPPAIATNSARAARGEHPIFSGFTNRGDVPARSPVCNTSC